MLLILLFAISTIVSGGTSLEHRPDALVPVNLELHQAKDGIRRITVTQLREALKNGKAILVDVRTERAYRAGHIKGAILIPVDEIGRRIDELPKNKLIATYCA